MLKGVSRLYYAFLIDDPTRDPAVDQLAVYLDVQMLGGDPAEPDRLIELQRDGSLVLRSGLGNNADGRGWSGPQDSDGIVAAVAEPVGGGWTAELAIDLEEQLPELLGDGAFASMILLTLGDETGRWPAEAETEDLATWPQLENVSCVTDG